MIFKNSFKIVGCKDVADAEEAVFRLYTDLLRKIPGACSLPKGKTPEFVFDVVMRNIDFDLGFAVDCERLNRLMNEKEYEADIHMSQHETTTTSNVTIKFKNPSNAAYYSTLVFPKKEAPYFKIMDNNPYKIKKKKDLEPKYITFIVFGSSKSILTGRSGSNVEAVFNTFIDLIAKNKK